MGDRDTGNDGVQSPFERPVRDVDLGAVAFKPTWVNKDDISPFAPIPGLVMQSLTGEAIMINWVTIQPRQVVPWHQHANEQAGVMLEGALELTIGEETRLMRPGDAYTIPPDMPHSARTLEEGCVVLDIFSPPRADYAAHGVGWRGERNDP